MRAGKEWYCTFSLVFIATDNLVLPPWQVSALSRLHGAGATEFIMSTEVTLHFVCFR